MPFENTPVMRTRTKALLLVIAGGSLLALLFLWITHLTTEPTYQDRTLSEWLAIRAHMYSSRNFGSPTESNDVVQAIRAIGTNGIPMVLEWMKYDPNTAVSARLRKVVGGLPLRSRQMQPLIDMLSGGQRRSDRSYDFWLCMGSNAAPAIPALTAMAYATNRAAASQHAVIALGVIGTNSYPILTRMLADTNFANRIWVPRSIALAQYRHTADWSPALPLLIQNLHDPDTNMCIATVSALGLMRIEPDICIPLLTNKLASTDREMQRVALYALRGFGERATSAVPFITLMLTNSEPLIRSVATNTLREIDPDALMQ